MKKLFLCFCLLFCVYYFTYTSDDIENKIKSQTDQANQQIENLNTLLDNKQVTNALILQVYAAKLMAEKPEFAKLLNNLVLDTQPNGPLIKGYQKILEDAQNNTVREDAFDDIRAVVNATNSEIYNQTLLDVVNVVADLSNGKLSPISSSTSDRDSNENGPGSQLVGNPHYGSWQTSGGQSFWVWYGMYRMFGDIWQRPYRYDSWYYNRPWSYYHDQGSGLYATRSQQRMHANINQSNQKQLKEYGRRSGRNMSAYEKRTNRNFQPSQASSKMRSSGSLYDSSRRQGTRSRSRWGGK